MGCVWVACGLRVCCVCVACGLRTELMISQYLRSSTYELRVKLGSHYERLYQRLKRRLRVSCVRVACELRVSCVRVACKLRAELTSYVRVMLKTYKLRLTCVLVAYLRISVTWYKPIKAEPIQYFLQFWFGHRRVNKPIKPISCVWVAFITYALRTCCDRVACVASLLRIRWSQAFAENYWTCSKFPNLLCVCLRSPACLLRISNL